MKKTEEERCWGELEDRRVSIMTVRVVSLFCSTSLSGEYRHTVGRLERDELGNK